MRWIVFSVAIFFLLPSFSFAQRKLKLNEGNAILANFSYGYQFPLADLKDRFGNSGVLHIGSEYWTADNWIIGVESSFLFGNIVKEDILANLRTAEGFIIANDRTVADVQLRERGIYVGGVVGKLFSLSEANERAGIKVTLGAGILQHKIRIQDEPTKVVAPLSGAYRKGYDRLTNGLTLTQFIGYQVLSTNRQVNFTLGVEFVEGFTQNRRSFNFDTRMQDAAMRLDMLLGLRLTWTLPFYLNEDGKEIIY